jgi:Doubled CXXCH motif (Paired_CXXCH_1)
MDSRGKKKVIGTANHAQVATNLFAEENKVELNVTHKCSKLLLRRTVVAATYLLVVFWSGLVLAGIQGMCADCHTMHNSQNGSPMNFDNSDTPNNNLVRGTCYGCHAQAGSEATVTLGTDSLPQVLHNGATDLAGGNFGYITGLKGSGAADNKGHNISDLTGTDGVLYAPPGGIKQSFHDDGSTVNTNNLSCAGTNGCHGYRYAGSGREGITGAHHQNEDGQLITANTPGNSYRFLVGVQGYETPDWQENPTSSTHNEYLGLTAPVKLGCYQVGVVSCHGASGIQPPDGTMSQYCATCHGNFHTLSTGSGDGSNRNSDGVGMEAASPFIRHPTDLALPATGEYAAYTVYDLDVPVARITVPASSSGAVTSGSDAVMCLSCHVSHGSDYASMLRWDYSTMIAGNGGSASNTGCFVCHSSKD